MRCTPRTATAVLAVTLTLSACADPPGVDTPLATPSPVDVDDEPEPDEPDPDPDPDPDDEPAPDPADPPTGVPDGELPGEAYDGPPVGGVPATLAVVGVAHDDVLNVRAAPGTDNEVVATLGPLATDVEATGRGRVLPSSIWIELEVDGVLGWASAAFLAHLGTTDDITSQIQEQLGTLPSAETLEELALIVADARATQEPESDVTISAAPTVGDLGEVTVDVVGFGDDALRAERLVVFATTDGEGFTVRTVEATTFCGRGTVGEACV